jgi:hypothetical protein
MISPDTANVWLTEFISEPDPGSLMLKYQAAAMNSDPVLASVLIQVTSMLVDHGPATISLVSLAVATELRRRQDEADDLTRQLEQ